MNAKDLVQYFTRGLNGLYELGTTIGIEVETQFVDLGGRAIRTEIAQQIFRGFVASGWRVVTRKGELLTELISPGNDRLLYELGRHNLEISAAPRPADAVVPAVLRLLAELYGQAWNLGVRPLLAPILETEEDLLVVPDERDAQWVRTDGRSALNNLTRCSAVQFTIDVPLKDAIRCVNVLNEMKYSFLNEYPQEELWRRYIKESAATYSPSRYGGPDRFADLDDYCAKLAEHGVVRDGRVVPCESAGEVDIPLFLRSVWWYFRLKRYGPKLCLEVRPFARGRDSKIQEDLDRVLQILGISGRERMERTVASLRDSLETLKFQAVRRPVSLDWPSGGH